MSSPSRTPVTFIIMLLCAALLSLSMRSASTVSSVLLNKGDYSSDEVLVTLEASGRLNNIKSCLQFTDFKIESTIKQLNVYVLKVPEGGVEESLGNLKNCNGVKKAEPNYIAKATDVIPNDPGFGKQYGLVAIRAPQGWAITQGLSSVTIAIVDTGIQLSHPDLAGKIVPGYDFVNNDNNPNDDNGHGTHVAGIAAAMTNDGVGVAGVSWGARLMPVKVLDATGSGTYSDVAQGIIWATDHGAQIINLSLGGSSSSSVVQGAVDYAYSHGVTLVAAAGNSSSNFVSYPARYPNVIAVAATDQFNSHASFSNYGPQVSVSAPGVAIYSTTLGGYGDLSGTSMSTPYVSGLAAILRGIPGNSSPDRIAWDMETTALDLGSPGPDQLYGYGLIQMDAAIRFAWPPAPQHPGSSAPFAPGGVIETPTSMPAITLTFSPTILPGQTSTANAITPTQTSIATETPEISALHTTSKNFSARPSLSSELGTDWPLGCWGILLILLGALVIQLGRRKRRPAYKGMTKSKRAGS